MIAREYIGSGMRQRGSEIATRWLGPRTELEIQREQMREIERPGWTGLDRALQRIAPDGRVTLKGLAEQCRDQRYRRLLIGRLQYLEGMGLCEVTSGQGWCVTGNMRAQLKDLARHRDIAKTKSREP